jgi:hypothetical protein
MQELWLPRKWRKFLRWLLVAIFCVSGIGFWLDEIKAAFSVIYGGVLSVFYLAGLVFSTGSYGGKVPLVLQLVGVLRFPITALGLALGQILSLVSLKWSIIGFVLFYPFLFVYNKWESD